MRKYLYLTIFMVITLLIDVSTHVNARPTENTAGWKEIEVLATAYCPCKKCCGKFADGKTAIGHNAFTKGVAVDRRIIPLRSRVKIPGYGMVTADDVGGAIKNNHIDVRFTSHQAALEWGRKNLTIYYQVP